MMRSRGTLAGRMGPRVRDGIEHVVDQEVVGRIGRVTGTVAPGKVGEVMVPIRGGTEAFNAYAGDRDVTIERGARVVIIEYHPPRTVVVTIA